jgi:hypothetical protein
MTVRKPKSPGEAAPFRSSTDPLVGEAPKSSDYMPLSDPEPPPEELSGGRSEEWRQSSLSSGVKETARSVGRAVREQVGEFTSEISGELGKTAEDQKARGVKAMQALAHAVDTAAEELEAQSPVVAGFVRDAARHVESLSANISGRNPNEIIEGATRLARSRPAVFFAGAVAAGFALSRFLRSSGAHEPAPPQGGMS